jgi:REP element-mobilizing transposase RayT
VRDDADREKRLDWLRRTVETYGWRLHAFVLMKNHDHLFVETPEANLSRGMQFLNGSYTSYFNRRHRRSGHLFQGRYKAQLVEEEGYYLEVSRYIHLNPVRVPIVARPEEYRWSSYPGYHWSGKTLPWVTYKNVLGEFSRNLKSARAAYRRFVQAGVQMKPASPFRSAFEGLIVGGEAFVGRIQSLLSDKASDSGVPDIERLRSTPTLAQIQEKVCDELAIDPRCWAAGRRSDDASRAIASYLARRHFGYRSKDIAAAFGYASSGGVGQAVKRVESGNASLKRTSRRLLGRLTNG